MEAQARDLEAHGDTARKLQTQLAKQTAEAAASAVSDALNVMRLAPQCSGAYHMHRNQALSAHGPDMPDSQEEFECDCFSTLVPTDLCAMISVQASLIEANEAAAQAAAALAAEVTAKVAEASKSLEIRLEAKQAEATQLRTDLEAVRAQRDAADKDRAEELERASHQAAAQAQAQTELESRLEELTSSPQELSQMELPTQTETRQSLEAAAAQLRAQVPG